MDTAFSKVRLLMKMCLPDYSWNVLLSLSNIVKIKHEPLRKRSSEFCENIPILSFVTLKLNKLDLNRSLCKIIHSFSTKQNHKAETEIREI